MRIFARWKRWLFAGCWGGLRLLATPCEAVVADEEPADDGDQAESTEELAAGLAFWQ